MWEWAHDHGTRWLHPGITLKQQPAPESTGIASEGWTEALHERKPSERMRCHSSGHSTFINPVDTQ